MDAERVRCPWVGNDLSMLRYHDEEWGVPTLDDRALFEFLTLEGAQAGLSWRTILQRREGYRRAFLAWDIEGVAAMGERDVERLLADVGIIRNRAKIEATIANARTIVQLPVTFSEYVWRFTDGVPTVNRWHALHDLPAATEASRAMSGQMKRDGFRFVGPTTLYAFMQAVGMVNDHLVTCFRYAELSGKS